MSMDLKKDIEDAEDRFNFESIDFGCIDTIWDFNNKCSVCNKVILRMKKQHFNYCPNCGSNMKESDSNEI